MIYVNYLKMDYTKIQLLIERIMDGYFTIYNSLGDYIYYFYFNYSRIILDSIHWIFDNTFSFFIFLTILLASFYLIMSISIQFKRKKKERPLIKGEEPFVTIQIPTYNELAAINCAKRCLDFEYPKDRMQIIIGDDSSDRTVSKKIDEFAEKHKGIVDVTRRGKNIGFKQGNLNHMLKYTKGDYIVIFDSDFLPEKDFLRRIAAPFQYDKDVAVVQARWNIYNFNNNIYSILGGTISMICHTIALPFINMIKGNCFLCGSAEIIKKKDLIEAGGWRTGSLTEDIECSLRIHMRGKKLIYLEDLECRCEAPFRFKDLCKQQMRWAFGVISSFKLHFMGIIRSKKMKRKDKLSVFLFGSGYMFSLLLLAITVFGILSVISNRPAPIDWARFITETMTNILLTSGFLVASVIALTISKKAKMIPKMIVSSLSVGLAVTYYVNVGILKAIFGRDMQWFMLNKMGNRNKTK